MTYNVGPDFTRPSGGQTVGCDGCGEAEVRPQWDGAEGQWRCPCCYAPLPDYSEEEEVEPVHYLVFKNVPLESLVKPRVRGAPAQERAECGSCGKRGLGNIYTAAARPGGAPRPYRQCRYCSEVTWL